VRKFVLLAIVVAATAVSSTGALAADVITRLTSERLSNVLKAGGATEIQVTKPEAGVEIVNFNDGSGMVNFVLLDCTAEGCGTLQMSILFDNDARFTPAVLNGYNATYLNAQAALMTSGKVALMDLFVTAGGVTEDNLKANIVIFLQSPSLFEKHLASQVTASLDTKGAAKPVAATTDVPAKKLSFGAQPPAKFDVMKWIDTQSKFPARRLP
jgi:Putative bacterial sensory transduction regulator